MSDTPLIFDWAGSPAPSAQAAPVTGRPGQAIYSPQGGIVGLGSDYGTSPKGQVLKVDAQGSQYVVSANPAGGNTMVYTSQAAPAAASQYGNLMMGRQDSPAPSTYYPVNLDMQMAMNVHLKSKPTFRLLAQGVTCAANKSLISVVYAGTGTMVLRLQEAFVYVPPSGYGGSSLLGSSSVTYYPLICELRRITTATGGTSLNPTPGDTADVLTAGVTCSAGATVGATVNVFHRYDAVQSTMAAIPWYGRGDVNEKSMVIRPGEGFSITCISSGTINNPNQSGTTTASVDLEVVMTQAVS